jgi:Fic family protein
VPPPPDEVAAALSALEKFVHGDDKLPLLVKIGLIHAQFETIHPFLDGNGRVGRLLITFLLCHNDVLAKPVLYLSHFFKQNRQQYYELLQAVRDTGDWEAWLRFFLRGVSEVSQQATETSRKILALRETHRELISNGLGGAAGNGHKTLDYLFRHPIVSVKEIQDLIGTTYPSANNLVARLQDRGVLTEVTGQRRHRRFMYADYIALFRD